MIVIGLIGCLMILLFVHHTIKDVMSPPFVLSGIWLFTYILLLLFRKSTVDLSSIYYLSFLGGLLFFILGFFIAVASKTKMNRHHLRENNNNLRFKLPYIQIFLLIIFILFCVYLVKVVKYVSQENTFNFWHTLSTGKKMGLFKIPLIIEYSRSAVIALSILCSIIFFCNATKSNKRYFYLSSLFAFFYVITAGNRGAIFFWILSILFSYLIVRNFNNRKLLLIFSRMLIIILIIFIYTSLIKYVHIKDDEAFEFSKYILKHYFTSAPIAFVEWMKSAKEYMYGANTFRFFIAIFKHFGGNIDVVQTVQEPIKITKLGEETNVYTVLHYYASDFGLFYAFFIQFILGITHGFLYKRACFSKIISVSYVALLAISYYPLLYQVFSDQYFTLFSSWIQYVIWFWIFTNPAFLIKSKILETSTT